MPPKSKAKTPKKIEKKPPKATKASAAKLDKDKLAAVEKAKETLKNDGELKLDAATPKGQESVEDLNVDVAPEEENRKRSSGDAILVAEEPIAQASAPKKLRLAEEDPLKKAIDEIEMEASSSETDYSEYYRQSARESVMPDVEKLLETKSLSDEDFSSVSSEADDPEYLKQNELEEEPDFFDNLGDVPAVSEVSLDASVDTAKEKPQMVDQKGPKDIGKFVNPLTGESASEETVKEKVKVKQIETVEAPAKSVDGEQQERDEPSDVGSVDIIIMSDQELVDEALTQKAADEEDVFNQFLELEAHGPIEMGSEIDMEALAREENARLLYMHTYEFVHDLIDRAVEKSEYIHPKVILRQNLDKRKLLQELQSKLALLEIERRGKQFLNRKCVEYFRRKRSFRPILDDNPKTLNLEVRKYNAAVATLDQWLIKEEEAKTLSQHNLEMLKEEIKVVKELSLKEISSLETIMKKTLQRENFDKIQIVVASSLVKMNGVREEISNVRFQLIQKQHSVATLVEQLRDLEDLGNGLSMRNFETIQTETQALGKKIEERNTELNKLRYRCYGDLHRMAHQKEKQKMLRDTIIFQRQYLDEVQIEKQRLREHIFKLKIKRSHLRKDMRDVSFQSGLLDKPVLMKDYDTTVEYLNELRDRVNQAKVTVNQLDEKISMLENQCGPAN